MAGISKEDVHLWHRRLAGVPPTEDLRLGHVRLDEATVTFAGREGLAALSALDHEDYVAEDPTEFECRTIGVSIGRVTLFSQFVTACTVVYLPRNDSAETPSVVVASKNLGTSSIRVGSHRHLVSQGRMAIMVKDTPLATDHLQLAETTGILLPLDLVEDVVGESPAVVPDTALTRAESDFISRLLFRWLTMDAQRAETQRDTENALIDMARVLLTQTRRATGDNGDRLRFVRERVTDIIERRHRQSTLNVATIAQELHMSRRQLYRYFDDEEGIASRLTARRLESAHRLLVQHPRMAIEDIAAQAGFADANLLRVHFKRRYGTSPSRFRMGIPPVSVSAEE